MKNTWKVCSFLSPDQHLTGRYTVNRLEMQTQQEHLCVHEELTSAAHFRREGELQSDFHPTIKRDEQPYVNKLYQLLYSPWK